VRRETSSSPLYHHEIITTILANHTLGTAYCEWAERTHLAGGSKQVPGNTDYEQQDNLSLLFSRPPGEYDGCETPTVESLQCLEDLLIMLFILSDQNNNL
jgi:hypothetical protein